MHPHGLRQPQIGSWYKNTTVFHTVFYLYFIRHFNVNLLAPELLFLILAHPVYKMRIIQETSMLEL